MVKPSVFISMAVFESSSHFSLLALCYSIETAYLTEISTRQFSSRAFFAEGIWLDFLMKLPEKQVFAKRAKFTLDLFCFRFIRAFSIL